jgi:mono/diheme cytochrome c family protein
VPEIQVSLGLMRHGSLFVLLAAVAGLTGCGGGGGGTLSQTRKAQALFASNCGACHSLIGNESRRRQGGDLVGYRLTRSQLLEFTREMPTRRTLNSSELNTLVDYVLEIEQHRRAH